MVDGAELPASWTDALRSCLTSDEPTLVAQSVATVSERGLPGFEDLLSHLATNEEATPSLRIAAAAAALAGLDATPTLLFGYLLEQCRSSSASFDRLAAAQAIGKAPLSGDQLGQLADAVRDAGPVELPLLVKPFENCADAAAGEKLVASLKTSSGTSSLSAESLSHLFDGFPEEVRKASEPLVESATAGVKDRGARLKAMMETFVGGDPLHGRDIFFSQRALCSACHRIDNQGGNVGPNLSSIGKIRMPRDLLEAILFPSASFAREYEPYSVLTAEGKTYAGVISRKTVQAVYLRGVDRSEIRIDRADIEMIQPSAISVMPQGLDKLLSENEIRDLVAFLSSRK